MAYLRPGPADKTGRVRRERAQVGADFHGSRSRRITDDSLKRSAAKHLTATKPYPLGDHEEMKPK